MTWAIQKLQVRYLHLRQPDLRDDVPGLRLLSWTITYVLTVTLTSGYCFRIDRERKTLRQQPSPLTLRKQSPSNLVLYFFSTYCNPSHLHNPKSPQNRPSQSHNRRFSFKVCPNLELDIPTDDLNDERTRNIERGSKIVTVMPTVHAVVLQAPRGNLETVNPRFMVLASVRHSIEMKDFRAAFFTCRTHRIDMNILHVHEPELFLANIPLFIQQLHDVDYIDLFLSSLR